MLISNESIEKMAEYMLTGGLGKYDEYLDWLEKLYNVYATESDKILNEYMNQ